MHYKYIRNHKWYYYLIPKENFKGLFSDYPRNSVTNKFLVCWDIVLDDKKSKMYAVFQSYLDFAIYFLKLDDHLKCFYEIILGETIQKPHFDVDMEQGDAEKVVSDLINVIIEILAEKNIILDPERDICLYSSHGENKKSYHLIINNYCHANNLEAKAFYYEVMKRLPGEYLEKKWIDSAVYSKTQQFRTFQSKKIGTERIKTSVKSWVINGKTVHHKLIETPEDENHEFLLRFEESVVTARKSNCRILPAFETQVKTNYSSNDIDLELGKRAFLFLAEQTGQSINDPKFPYRFDHIEDSFVILKRAHPSKCRICLRIHHNKNPYLIVTPETDVYFHCRRSEKKWYVGRMDKTEEVIEEKVVPEERLERAREMANRQINRLQKPEKKYTPGLVSQILIKSKK